MPIIIKVGYQEFLAKSEVQAARVMTALVGAVALESKTYAGKELFWPAEHGYQHEIGTRVIRADQLRAHEPEDVIRRPAHLELPAATGGAQ